MTPAPSRRPEAGGGGAHLEFAEPPRRSARVRAAVSGMVVLVLVGFSAAVVAAIVTPGGERVEISADAGAEGCAGGLGSEGGAGVSLDGDLKPEPDSDPGGDPDRNSPCVPVGGDGRADGVPNSPPGVDAGADPGVSTVVVHVSGAVAQPGVVELLIGSRVVDALAQAGGPVDEADLSALNLARPLVDGEQVHVSVVGESPPGGAASPGSSGSPAGAAAGAGAVVNINTAGPAELETLPGVGPALAGRIIAWREQNGQFRSVDELLAVSGIGEKTLAGFRDQVTV